MIKKYWWVILLVLAFLGGFLLKWVFTPAPVGDELNRIKTERELLVKKHRYDSVQYAKTTDSMATIIEGLKVVSTIKGQEIVRLRALNKGKRDEIAKLPPVQAVQYFSDRTGMESTLLADSTVLTPLPAITIANTLIFERYSFESENDALISRSEIQDTIISKQSVLLNLKDIRIVNLTNEYYASQRIMNDQNSVIKKQKKNIRTKNALVGILGGIAVGAVVVTLVK
jgi:hypothetical protein